MIRFRTIHNCYVSGARVPVGQTIETADEATIRILHGLALTGHVVVVPDDAPKPTKKPPAAPETVKQPSKPPGKKKGWTIKAG